MKYNLLQEVIDLLKITIPCDTNSAEETRLQASLCAANINTKQAFVRQCNFDARKDNDAVFTPKNSSQKESVRAGGT